MADNYSGGKNPIRQSWEVFEAIDRSEYLALGATPKEYVKLVLSLSVINLAEGSNGRNTLWAAFDENSTTRANLLDLIKETTPDY